MKELYDFACEIATLAGQNTLKYFRQSFDVETKADSSPVTIADRSTEELLRAEIEKRFPDDGIIGEEYGVKEGKTGRRWVLDPIDGTKSFVRGFPAYGNLIGVVEGDQSIVGVVHFAAMGETVAAYQGGGCYYNGERCQVSTNGSIIKATALSSDFRDCVKRWGDKALLRLFDETGLQRTWGDCYGYLMVATGRADIMVDAYLHIWDVAALAPVIQEAGGKCTNVNGLFDVNVDHLIATNGLIHDDVLQLFQAK